MPDPLTPLAVLDAFANVFVVILGIGFLIFVHELGHFVVAKWNKVRVEAFSLGFGPVLWGFRRGDTHYRLSLIPLGGYVKMAGETPGDDHTDDPAEFQNKSIPARAAVLIAGVVMNAFVAIVLFVVAFNVGVPLVAPVVGSVAPGSTAWEAGIRSGDRVLKVGDRDVLDMEDVLTAIAFASGPVDVRIERDGEEILVEDIQPVKNEAAGIQLVGIEPANERAIIVEPDTPADRAGMKTGDVLVTIAGYPTGDTRVVARAMANSPAPVEFVVDRDGERLTIPVTPDTRKSERPLLGIQPVEKAVALVVPGSAADAHGFRRGDEIVRVNSSDARSFHHARELARAAAPAPVRFTVLRDEAETRLEPLRFDSPEGWDGFFSGLISLREPPGGTTCSLTPDLKFEDGNPAREAGFPEGATIAAVAGKKVSRWAEIPETLEELPASKPVPVTYVLGDGEPRTIEVVRRRPLVRLDGYGIVFQRMSGTRRVPGILNAVGAGLRRSLQTASNILQMIGGIFTGRVSAKNLGVPIFIFEVSYRSADRNFVHFLYFLAILSVNLAILNVLPIPVLDGGHLMFLAIEAIRRKPLSERAMGMAQMVGLLLLLMLMAFVIVNDVGRHL